MNEAPSNRPSRGEATELLRPEGASIPSDPKEQQAQPAHPEKQLFNPQSFAEQFKASLMQVELKPFYGGNIVRRPTDEMVDSIVAAMLDNPEQAQKIRHAWIRVLNDCQDIATIVEIKFGLLGETLERVIDGLVAKNTEARDEAARLGRTIYDMNMQKHDDAVARIRREQAETREAFYRRGF